MILRICAIVLITVGILASILSVVAYFTAGIAPAIYFALLAIFSITVGRWWK